MYTIYLLTIALTFGGFRQHVAGWCLNYMREGVHLRTHVLMCVCVGGFWQHAGGTLTSRVQAWKEAVKGADTTMVMFTRPIGAFTKRPLQVNPISLSLSLSLCVS